MLGIAAFLAAALIVPAAVAADGTAATQVYRFANEPFNYSQCYSPTDFFPGPAATFGQAVCVAYQAENSETVTVQGTDVAWSLVQVGTATVTATAGSTVLYSGPFDVQEVSRAIDLACMTPDHHAYIGNCTGAQFTTDLTFLRYNWMITGNAVYSFEATVTAPGEWCFASKQRGQFGPGC